MAILDVVARSPSPMRFSDLLAATGEPRGTLHRRLHQMLEEGLLETGSDGRYSLGLRLMQFASVAWARNDLRTIVRPHLEALREKVGETVHFGVLNGVEIAYLDKVEALQNVRMHSRVGAVSPVYCTGIGKAALALLDDRILAELLPNISFRQFTQTTIRDGDQLLAAVRSVRQQGVAYDLEEHEPGICCIAVGIAAGEKACGVSITAPAYRADRQRLDSWREDLVDAARRIELELFARLGPGGRSVA
ncbi:IclR family transcriptional regulator [Rhizobium sp. C4]|nr:IclR family transcriptional regulator [Rhizobium sp. C4]MCD2172896.1 IclR family transcriptional regulator [Rhizobium sp. C4]